MSLTTTLFVYMVVRSCLVFYAREARNRRSLRPALLTLQTPRRPPPPTDTPGCGVRAAEGPGGGLSALRRSDPLGPRPRGARPPPLRGAHRRTSGICRRPFAAFPPLLSSSHPPTSIPTCPLPLTFALAALCGMCPAASYQLSPPPGS